MCFCFCRKLNFTYGLEITDRTWKWTQKHFISEKNPGIFSPPILIYSQTNTTPLAAQCAYRASAFAFALVPVIWSALFEGARSITGGGSEGGAG